MRYGTHKRHRFRLGRKPAGFRNKMSLACPGPGMPEVGSENSGARPGPIPASRLLSQRRSEDPWSKTPGSTRLPSPSRRPRHWSKTPPSLVQSSLDPGPGKDRSTLISEQVWLPLISRGHKQGILKRQVRMSHDITVGLA